MKTRTLLLAAATALLTVTAAHAEPMTAKKLTQTIAEMLTYDELCGGLPERMASAAFKVGTSIPRQDLIVAQINVGHEVDAVGKDKWCATVKSIVIEPMIAK